MPVLKIFYDERLDDAVRRRLSVIEAELTQVISKTLKADATSCQIILASCLKSSPSPLYADLQFRANEFRTDELIANAMQEIANVFIGSVGAGIRIRAFSIDEATLHALDADN